MSGPNASVSRSGHAGGGFVEADDPGLEGEDAGQLADAAGPGGEGADEVVGEGTEAEVVDELAGAGQLVSVAASPRGDPDEHREHVGRQHPFVGEGHGLEHGEVAEETGVLERAAEPVPGPVGGGHRADVPAEQFDGAPGGHEPADRVHDRGLARTVGPDETDDFVALHPEVDVVDDPVGAELDDEASDREVGPAVAGRVVIDPAHAPRPGAAARFHRVGPSTPGGDRRLARRGRGRCRPAARGHPGST